MMKLGIDFGTSYSYFAVQLDDEDHTIIQLGENTLAGDYLKKNDKYKLLDSWKGIRTCVGLNDKGSWCVGATALKLVPGERKVVDLKTKLRLLSTKSETNSKGMVSEFERFNKIYGIAETTLTELTKVFFREVFLKGLTDIRVRSYKAVDSIVIGMPARKYGDEVKYRTLLKTIVSEVISELPAGQQGNKWFGKDVTIQVREEPFLASVTFLKHQTDHDEICVIDIGGGTSDCTFIQRLKGNSNVYYVSECAGGSEPAGGDLDSELKKTINSRLKDGNSAGVEVDFGAITKAKEVLFANRAMSDVQTNMIDNNFADNYIGWFSEYIKKGRRAVIELSNQKQIPLVYDNNHIADTRYCLMGRGTRFETKDCINFKDTINFKDMFLYEDPVTHDASVIKKACERIKIRKPDAIVFVGGTCGIHELRQHICAEADINVDLTQLFTDAAVEGHYNGTDKRVMVYSSCNSEKITGSNAIAYGGIYLCESEINIYDKPYDVQILYNSYYNPELRPFKIKIEGDREIDNIMSLDIAFNNIDGSMPYNHRRMAFFNESKNSSPSEDNRYWKYLGLMFGRKEELSQYTGDIKVRFYFKIGEKIYPRRGFYSISLQTSLVYNNLVRVYVFCDYDNDAAEHRIYLMIQCVNKQEHSSFNNKHKILYSFNDYNGVRHEIQLDNIIVPTAGEGYIREYVIGETGDEDDSVNIRNTGWKSVKGLRTKNFKEVI